MARDLVERAIVALNETVKDAFMTSDDADMLGKLIRQLRELGNVSEESASADQAPTAKELRDRL